MSEFELPPGKAMGCLPRRYKLGEVCPLAAEHIPLVPRADWPSLAREVSLRPMVKTVLDQDGVGSCATESTTQAVMISRAFSGLRHVVLNPWFIYRVTSGGRDRGSSIDDNLAFVRENGIAPEALHPRAKGWSARPSDEAIEAAKAFKIVEFYDIANVDEMVSALLTGWPVVYGAVGHSVCAVAHLPDGSHLDINSWGTTWKDGGFGQWAAYNRIDFGYGMFAVRTTTEVK